jgi:outer membrane lipoprotein-sorting protein
MLKIFKTLYFFTFLIFLFYIYELSASSKTENNFRAVQQYLKNLNTLEANFIQISSDGDIKRGKIFFNLPGKLRIDYIEPDDLLITSNGFWLTIQNKKLQQTNNLPLERTPLNLFLNKKFNFEDNSNIKFKYESDVVTLSFFGDKKLNESKFELEFSLNPIILRKWVIIDEFENQTSVMLQNIKLDVKLSNKIFIPDYYNEKSD